MRHRPIARGEEGVLQPTLDNTCRVRLAAYNDDSGAQRRRLPYVVYQTLEGRGRTKRKYAYTAE